VHGASVKCRRLEKEHFCDISMAYDVRQWPNSVYPGEVNRECPEALEVIDTLLRNMMRCGPSPAGYQVKALGAKKGGLWQINLKVEKRQIRVLYAPDGHAIILFRIHKKGSPQEQQRAYELAVKRKADYERAKQSRNGRHRTIH
jgi:hypothetical protein